MNVGNRLIRVILVCNKNRNRLGRVLVGYYVKKYLRDHVSFEYCVAYIASYFIATMAYIKRSN